MPSEGRQTHSWYERLLNIISVVKPGEGPSCLILTLCAGLLMAVFYSLKVVREPLILDFGGAEFKSYATAIQAAIMMLMVPLFTLFYQRFAHRISRSGIVRATSLFFVFNLLVFYLLELLNWDIAFAFYVWHGLFGVMVLAQFWAFAADCYNVRSGQRLFVILAVGATFGSFLGARVADELLQLFQVDGTLLLAALVLLVVWLLCANVCDSIPYDSFNHEDTAKDAQQVRWLDGFALVFRNKYLFYIAIFVMLLVFVNSSGEFLLARFVIDHTQALGEQMPGFDEAQWQSRFYASYYSWITLISFALQTLLVSRIFKWFKIKGGILILPILMILSYTLLLFFPVFSLIRMVMIAENSVHYSLQNTIHQALFLPASRRHKYLGKTTIDTFFFRIGDLIYGGVIILGTQLGGQVVHLMLLNLVVSVFLLLLAWRVGHRNAREVQRVLGNHPPHCDAHIPQMILPAGQTSAFSLSDSTFVDPDLGDALTYFAQQESGAPLPDWIRFDRISRTFTFAPPAGYHGQMHIQVYAKDFEGMSTHTQLDVTVVDPDGHHKE